MQNNFDTAAANYDASFTHTHIGKQLRLLVHEQLNNLLPNKTQNILEINCGTGEDALWLAKKNHEVIATDVSAEMIRVAQEKQAHNKVQFAVANINTITQQFSDKKFEQIFSNFGGLNCLDCDQMSSFLQNIGSILTKKGKLVLVIMPKNTLWEKIYFLLKGKPKTAFRRTKKMVLANVEGVQVPTYYFNPKEVANMASENFNCKQVTPIGFFIPPSYLEPFIQKNLTVFKWLITLEHTIKHCSFLSKYADHYLIVLEKK